LKTVTGKRELNIAFIWGILLGVLCFLVLFGTIVINPVNDAWIMKRDLDLRQHYVGWMAFRNSDWTYPIGMINSLSYPIKMSIVFTDSIPLVAVFFKLIRGILPETFQYFGLFTLACFALQGGFAARILRRITDKAVIWIAMPVIFVLSFPMIQRSFYHTSLTAQWIILLCIDLWMGGVAYKTSKEKMIIWGLVSLLCVGIHTYFLPMALCLLCGSELERLIGGGYKNRKPALVVTEIAGAGASFILCAAVLLYILGAFSSPSSEEYWVGDFCANLNTFFNSNGRTLFLKGLPLYGEFQREGLAYLGMGIILVGVVAVVFEIVACVRRHGDNRNDVDGSSDGSNEKSMARERTIVGWVITHPTGTSLVVVSVIFVLVSVLPTVTFGDKLLFAVPYSRTVLKIVGIFRSNGRFIWPVMYMIFMWVAYEMDRFGNSVSNKLKNGVSGSEIVEANDRLKFGRILVTVIVLICVVTQLVDFYPWLRRKYRKFHKEYASYITDWDELGVPEEYEHFVIFQDDTTYRIALAYYTQKQGMTTNSFYFARGIEGLIEEENKKHMADIMGNSADEKTVYVFDRETYEAVKSSGLHFYKCEKSVCGTVNPIEGRSELTEEELESVEFPE